MQQVCEGNVAAMEKLYDRYFVKLCNFAQKAYQQPNAEDIVQDVMLKIFQQPNLYNPRFAFQTWIYSLVSNKCKSEWKKQQTKEIASFYLEASTNFAAEYQALDNQLLKLKINKALMELEECERTIFVLKYEHELKNQEIADILEIPIGTVKSSIFYLLKKMQQILLPIYKEQI